MRIFLLALLATSLAVNAGLWLRYVSRPGRGRTVLARACLVVFPLVYLVLIGEALVVQFPMSDGFLVTMGARNWMDKYYLPINSLGYRDDEHVAASLADKKLLLVVGDSFVAGNGIQDYRRRFPNVLGNLLGDEWVVAILAKGGFNTGDEYDELLAYPYRPDLIVWSYYINDIDGAARRLGRDFRTYPEGPPEWLVPIVNRSALANLVFWRFARGGEEMSQIYWEHLTAAYGDGEVWEAHLAELEQAVRFAAERRIPLVAVTFPHLRRVAQSRAFTDKVSAFLDSRGVPVVDVADLLAGRDPDTMVVNALDAHPNEGVHQEVASLLHDVLAQQGLLQ